MTHRPPVRRSCVRATHAAVHELLAAGHSQRAVARQLDMGGNTVARGATPEAPFTGQWQNRPTKLDDYKPYLQYEKVAAPTLLITGEKDLLYPRDLAEQTAKRIPHATLKLYTGRGHTGVLRDKSFYPDIIRFLVR